MTEPDSAIYIIMSGFEIVTLRPDRILLYQLDNRLSGVTQSGIPCKMFPEFMSRTFLTNFITQAKILHGSSQVFVLHQATAPSLSSTNFETLELFLFLGCFSLLPAY